MLSTSKLTHYQTVDLLREHFPQPLAGGLRFGADLDHEVSAEDGGLA